MDKANVSNVITMDILRQKMVLAEQLATNTLSKNKFDADAYLILGMNKLLENIEVQKAIDVIPQSSVDETTAEMLKCFINYFESNSIAGLRCCMAQLQKIFSEIYHTCQTQEERDIVREEIVRLQFME